MIFDRRKKIKRRDFIRLFGAVTATRPLAAPAQHLSEMRERRAVYVCALLADPLTTLCEYRFTAVGSENVKGERAMKKRTLLGLILGCVALVGFAAPTPANAWCRCYSGYGAYGAYGAYGSYAAYGAYGAYAYSRPVVTYRPVVAYRPVVTYRPVVAVAPVVVRPVVAAVAVPVVRVAYQPVYYTSYAYRPTVVGSAYAYAPGFRRVWWNY